MELLGGAAKGDPTLAAELALARIVQYERTFAGAILVYSRIAESVGAACFGFGSFPYSIATEHYLVDELVAAHNVLDSRRDPLTGVFVVTISCASVDELLAAGDPTKRSDRFRNPESYLL